MSHFKREDDEEYNKLLDTLADLQKQFLLKYLDHTEKMRLDDREELRKELRKPFSELSDKQKTVLYQYVKKQLEEILSLE